MVKDTEVVENENLNEPKKDGNTNGTDVPAKKLESPKKKPSSPIALNPSKLSPKIGEFFFFNFFKKDFFYWKYSFCSSIYHLIKALSLNKLWPI